MALPQWVFPPAAGNVSTNASTSIGPFHYLDTFILSWTPPTLAYPALVCDDHGYDIDYGYPTLNDTIAPPASNTLGLNLANGTLCWFDLRSQQNVEHGIPWTLEGKTINVTYLGAENGEASGGSVTWAAGGARVSGTASTSAPSTKTSSPMSPPTTSAAAVGEAVRTAGDVGTKWGLGIVFSILLAHALA